MNSFNIKQFLKTWILPISMMGGIIFNKWMGHITFVMPYCIFIMLTIAYTRVKPSEFKFTGMQAGMLVAQMLLAWAAYFLLLPFNEYVAMGAFICAFMPTATSAPVVTGMLGGSIPKLATYSLLCNLSVAITAPMFLSWINPELDVSFQESFIRICEKVGPMLLLPLLVAFAMRYLTPRLHKTIAHHQNISFWIWAVSLFIVMGQAVSFVINQPHNVDSIFTMIGLAVASATVCVAQFIIGRKIGGRYNDKISGAQGLGQKNTILGLWLSITYLNPITAVAPTVYIITQNCINSWQLWNKKRKEAKSQKVKK